MDEGISLGLVMALVEEATGADPAVIEQAVQDWLDDHPEATTTVADGSITEQKLAAAVAAKINQVSQLSDEIDDIGSDVTDLKSNLSDEETARINADNALSTSISNLGTHKVAQPLDENNQPTDGTSGQLLRTKGDGTTEWTDVGLPTDEQTAQAISDWLAEHPEATTTVQDGSLTEAKFTDALKLKTIKGYVTPEMFGAKGDGVTDDSVALQDAIDSGKAVILTSGKTYAFSQSLYFERDNTIAFRLINNGILKYTGSDFGIYITSCEYNVFKFGRMTAPDGNCIKVRNNSNKHTVYLDFYFKTMSANTTHGVCFAFDINNSNYKYINDIRFFNGKFASCFCAVKFVRDSRSSTEYASYRFNNTAFEGCTYIIELCKEVSKLYFNMCRLLESVTRFFTYDANYAADNTHAIAIWNGADISLAYLRDCSNVVFQIISGGYTIGRAYFGDGVFYNNILYLSGKNSDYSYDIGNNTIETIISGCDRKSLSRVFHTPVANGNTKDVVISGKIFQISLDGADESDLFQFKDFPFNKILVICRTYSSGGVSGTIRFIDDGGNVLYSITGTTDQFVEISYSTYNAMLTFKVINQERISKTW